MLNEIDQCEKQIKSLQSGQEKDAKLLASAKFDVWSFGVVLYEVCSKDPLFHRDKDDNLLVKEQQRLSNWPGLSPGERDAVLRDCKKARPH